MSETLKPCPFCGSPAKMGMVGREYYVTCTKVGTCFGRPHVRPGDNGYENREDAAKLWNTRPAQAGDAIREALVEATDYDAGLLNDFGGGNVEWWLDYLRAEINRANDHWRNQIDAALALQPATGRTPDRGFAGKPYSAQPNTLTSGNVPEGGRHD